MEISQDILEHVQERIKETVETGNFYLNYLNSQVPSIADELKREFIYEGQVYVVPQSHEELIQFKLAYRPINVSTEEHAKNLLNNVNLDSIENVKQLDNTLTDDEIFRYFANHSDNIEYEVDYLQDADEWNEYHGNEYDLARAIDKLEESHVIEVIKQNIDIYKDVFKEKITEEYGRSDLDPSDIDYEIVNVKLPNGDEMVDYYFYDYRESDKGVTEFVNDSETIVDLIENDFITFDFQLNTEASELNEY